MPSEAASLNISAILLLLTSIVTGVSSFFLVRFVRLFDEVEARLKNVEIEGAVQKVLQAKTEKRQDKAEERLDDLEEKKPDGVRRSRSS